MRFLICTTCLLSQCFEGVFRGGFPVSPLSYKKLFRAVYRQKIYLYLVRFSGMLRCWLQRYSERIRTLEHPSYIVILDIRYIHTTKLIARTKEISLHPFSLNEQFLLSIAMKSIPSRVILFYVSSLVYLLFHVP